MSNSIVRDTLSLNAGNDLRYALFRKTAEGTDPTPLLVCLHPGWKGEVPPPYYGEQFLASLFLPAFSDTGATIVSPDCLGGAWNNPRSLLAILELIDHLQDRFAIEQRQISLVGYSAGGWGAWYFIQENAKKFTSAIMLATIPVIDPVDRFQENLTNIQEMLSNGLDELTSRVPDLPIYIIHSQDDEVIPYAKAMLAYQAISKVHMKVELHPTKGMGHYDSDSYVQALRNSIPWLINTWKLTSNS
jgi:predicted esterase